MFVLILRSRTLGKVENIVLKYKQEEEDSFFVTSKHVSNYLSCGTRQDQALFFVILTFNFYLCLFFLSRQKLDLYDLVCVAIKLIFNNLLQFEAAFSTNQCS